MLRTPFHLEYTDTSTTRRCAGEGRRNFPLLGVETAVSPSSTSITSSVVREHYRAITKKIFLSQTAHILLAAIESVLAWEWVTSGINKVLSGTFPQGLADTLQGGIKDNPNGWYVSFLKDVVMPHSVLFGYFIQWVEIAIGVVLLAHILLLLFSTRLTGEAGRRVLVIASVGVSLAAMGGALLTVNFHFWAGGWIFPTFSGDAANGEGVDLDALLPPLSLIILLTNIALIRAIIIKHRTLAPASHQYNLTA